jgi:hypothetical protein
MKDLITMLILIICILFVIIIVVALSAVITMFAWNIIIPAVFGLSKISFLQAVGLNILLGLITSRVRVNK